MITDNLWPTESIRKFPWHVEAFSVSPPIFELGQTVAEQNPSKEIFLTLLSGDHFLPTNGASTFNLWSNI